jgi:hypothetical protein
MFEHSTALGITAQRLLALGSVPRIAVSTNETTDDERPNILEEAGAFAWKSWGFPDDGDARQGWKRGWAPMCCGR